jgi:hypothetical protein
MPELSAVRWRRRTLRHHLHTPPPRRNGLASEAGQPGRACDCDRLPKHHPMRRGQLRRAGTHVNSPNRTDRLGAHPPKRSSSGLPTCQRVLRIHNPMCRHRRQRRGVQHDQPGRGHRDMASGSPRTHPAKPPHPALADRLLHDKRRLRRRRQRRLDLGIANPRRLRPSARRPPPATVRFCADSLPPA